MDDQRLPAAYAPRPISRQQRRPFIRPPAPPKPPLVLRGPRVLQRRTIRVSGPGLPPPGFVSPANSLSEWMWYWASMRVLDPDRDPREPPYFGGRLWRYQSPQIGGFIRAAGSAVVDFLYLTSSPGIVVRIVTYYYHLAAGPEKHTADRVQLARLATDFHVVDVYEEDFITDATGEAAIILLKDVLGMIRRENPLAAGTTLFVRNPLSRDAARM